MARVGYRRMLGASRERLLAEIPDHALVLDVGGWAKPFARADAVIDLMPYDTRGLYGYDGDRSDERFTEDTWTVHDLCGRLRWPYADNAFDFAVCSHTLEDVRDPLAVCDELVRVARAGYVEVPSRLEEQTWGVHGRFAGWPHHHWLCDVDPSEPRIEFLYKNAVVHTEGYHFPAAFGARLDSERRVSRFWWTASFSYCERIIMDREELLAALREPVQAHVGEMSPPSPPSLARRLTYAARLGLDRAGVRR